MACRREDARAGVHHAHSVQGDVHLAIGPKVWATAPILAAQGVRRLVELAGDVGDVHKGPQKGRPPRHALDRVLQRVRRGEQLAGGALGGRVVTEAVQLPRAVAGQVSGPGPKQDDLRQHLVRRDVPLHLGLHLPLGREVLHAELEGEPERLLLRVIVVQGEPASDASNLVRGVCVGGPPPWCWSTCTQPGRPA